MSGTRLSIFRGPSKVNRRRATVRISFRVIMLPLNRVLSRRVPVRPRASPVNDGLRAPRGEGSPSLRAGRDYRRATLPLTISYHTKRDTSRATPIS
jgi:hypothetical protein